SQLLLAFVGILFSFRSLLGKAADEEGHDSKERQAEQIIAANYEGKSRRQQEEIRDCHGQNGGKDGSAKAAYASAERHGCEEKCKRDGERRRQKLQQQREQHKNDCRSVPDTPARTTQVAIR